MLIWQVEQRIYWSEAYGLNLMMDDLQDERNNAIYESPVYGCKAMIMEPQIRIGINDKPPNGVTHGPRGYDYKLMMIDLQASIAVDNKNTPPPDFIIQ